MTFQFWYRWLVVVTVGVIIYGFLLMLLPESMYRAFNRLFFASDAGMPSGEIRAYIHLVQGVLGAVLIGWMVTILSVLMSGFRQKQRAAWRTLLLSILIWFAIDSGFSLLIAVPAHALFNTLFLALFALPLAATYHDFQTKGA